MKNLVIILGLLITLCFGGCQEHKPVTKKVEKKTGLETNSATSTEVDTLNKKINDLTTEF